MDIVILYLCCVTTTLYTKAPQINLCGAFALWLSKIVCENVVVVTELNF